MTTTTNTLDAAIDQIDDMIADAIRAESIGQVLYAAEILTAAVRVADATCPPDQFSEAVTEGHRRVVMSMFERRQAARR